MLPSSARSCTVLAGAGAGVGDARAYVDRARGESREKTGLSETLPERMSAARSNQGRGRSNRTELRAEVREGDEETRRYMRVLHEEVLSRIAVLQEGLPRRRKR